MSSCDLNCDYVLSAIKYSKFDSAKKLCDILSIRNNKKFTYFYGIVNLALDNEILSKNIVLNGTFLEIFTEHFKNRQPFELEKYFETSNWEADFAFCARKLKNEIINPNSEIRKIIEGKRS